MEENFLKYIKLNHFAIQLKLTEHCKSTVFQLKIVKQFFSRGEKNILDDTVEVISFIKSWFLGPVFQYYTWQTRNHKTFLLHSEVWQLFWGKRLMQIELQVEILIFPWKLRCYVWQWTLLLVFLNVIGSSCSFSRKCLPNIQV